MKNIIKLAFLAVLLLGFSCSKETITDATLDGTENLNAQAAKGKKARPIKAKLFNFADPNQSFEDLLLCAPEFPLTRNILGGNMSHLGKLQQGLEYDETAKEPVSGSFGVPISCNINLETFAQLTTEFKVYYVAANGDRIETTEQVTINFPNFNEDGTIDYTTGTFEGTEGFDHAIVIDGGTGRFKGASGHLDFVGAVFGPEGSTWELVGEIIY